MSKFYTANQMNSGGYYIQDENVDKFVIIEATSIYDFKGRALEILEPYREYCECCGQRWNDEYATEQNGYEKPSIYGTYYKDFNDAFWCINGKCIIYYLNGTKEIYDLTQNIKATN